MPIVTDPRYECFTPNGKGTEMSLARFAKKIGYHYRTVRLWALKGRQGVRLRVCRMTHGLGTNEEEYRLFLFKLARHVRDEPRV
jgi:hypothetical protein